MWKVSFAHVGRDTWVQISVYLDVSVNQREKINVLFIYKIHEPEMLSSVPPCH